jgi:chromosomal replication initiation ATPase DnaA
MDGGGDGRTSRTAEPAEPAAALLRVSATARASEAAVSCALAIPARRIRAASRCGAEVALARQVAMYLVRVTFEHGFAEIGRAFGRDRTTASHACRVVEDRRDDDRFDLSLQALEGALAAWERTFGVRA